MSVTYKYNNVDVFNGISRAPLLERSEEIIRTGTIIARADSFILTGQIRRTECEGGFENTFNLTKNLILAFAENFRKFEIIEDAVTIFSHDNAIIESISIEENKYYDLIPFTIRLTCYQDSYADLYGVLEPSDIFEYEETEGCLVSITHTISARGINTSSDALTNARNFVSALTGYSHVINPYGYTVSSPVLVKKQENINRFTGEVSITENYLYDKSSLSDDSRFILTYTTDLTEDNGVITVSVSGVMKGSIDSNIVVTREGFGYTNFWSIANTFYQTVGSGSLPSYPIQYSAEENVDDNSISFSYTYQNNTTTDPYVIDSTTISIDGANHCIAVTLLIKSDVGCPSERLRKTKAYFATLDLDAYIQAKWAVYGTGKRLGNAISKSVSFNDSNGDITIQSTVCSNTSENCGCIENLKYSISISPSIPQFAEEASYAGEGCYYIQDLNYGNRAKISISGTARPSKCCTNEAVKSQIYSRVAQLLTEYFQATDIVLDGAHVEISEDRTVLSFTFSWNGYQSIGLSDTYVYATF